MYLTSLLSRYIGEDMKKAVKHIGIALCLIFGIILIVQAKQNYGNSSKNFKLKSMRLNVSTREKRKHSIVLKGHFSQNIPTGQACMFQSEDENLSIRRNGEVLYERESLKETAPFSKRIWVVFDSPGISKKDDIQITLSGNNISKNDMSFTDNMYCGSQWDMIRHQIKRYSIEIVIGCIAIGVGIGCLVTFLFLKHIPDTTNHNYISCGFMFIFGGICSMIDYEYVLLIFPNLIAANLMDYYTQILFLGFFLSYLNIFYQTERFKKAGRVVMDAYIILVFLSLSLQAAKIFELSKCVDVSIPLGTVMLFVMLILLSADNIKSKNKITTKMLISSYIFGIVTILESAWFKLNKGYWIIGFQVALLIFAFLQMTILIKAIINLLEQGRLAEQRIEKNRVSIMLSQIQPHFLYNALEAVAYLCHVNPPKAEETVTEFSMFLRGNMDSLNCPETISFKQELQHTKHYLAIELVRFGDKLNIEYDIQSMSFRLPPLTLQPIVENAVRYGVTKKEEGGTIHIKSWETDMEYKVMVQDDGMGFDPYEVKEDGRSHIGIQNVRDRIVTMCGGTVEIDTKKGIGTKVVITIPKEAREK